MKNKILLIIGIMALLLLSGCKDITGTFKPGNFGNTAEEKAVVQAVTEKYGDLTARGNPRFLEPVMTSRLVNFIPVDVVSKYSKNTDEFIVWFIYDNFNKDELSIEWKYLDTDHVIHTFKSQTGDNFGRGAFILEKPLEGWPLGNYQVTITGRSISEVVTFEVIDGPTQSVPFGLVEASFDLEEPFVPDQITEQETTPPSSQETSTYTSPSIDLSSIDCSPNFQSFFDDSYRSGHIYNPMIGELHKEFIGVVPKFDLIPGELKIFFHVEPNKNYNLWISADPGLMNFENNIEIIVEGIDDFFNTYEQLYSFEYAKIEPSGYVRGVVFEENIRTNNKECLFVTIKNPYRHEIVPDIRLSHELIYS